MLLWLDGRPPQTTSGAEASVNSVTCFPQNVDQVLVCNRSPTVYLMTLQGQVRRRSCIFASIIHLIDCTYLPLHELMACFPWHTRTGPVLIPAYEHMCVLSQVVKTFQSGKREGGDFMASTVSPRGEWVYCLGEDGMLYCFGTGSGKLEHLMKVRPTRILRIKELSAPSMQCTFALMLDSACGIYRSRKRGPSGSHTTHIETCSQVMPKRGC